MTGKRRPIASSRLNIFVILDDSPMRNSFSVAEVYVEEFYVSMAFGCKISLTTKARLRIVFPCRKARSYQIFDTRDDDVTPPALADKILTAMERKKDSP